MLVNLVKHNYSYSIIVLSTLFAGSSQARLWKNISMSFLFLRKGGNVLF